MVLNTDYRSFSLPEDRILKIVIKGIFRDITVTEVAEKLTSQDFKVKNIWKFGTPNKKLPIHIDIEKHP